MNVISMQQKVYQQFKTERKNWDINTTRTLVLYK